MAESDIKKILVLIGGILGLLQGISSIIGWGGFYSGVVMIIMGIIAILLGLVVIVSSGFLKISLPFKIPFEKIPLLIVGIVFCVISSYLGGVLIIIAAILLFLEK